MQYIIQNKLFSFTGSSKVLDSKEKEIYKVKGMFLSPTKKKKICDLQGNVLYVVKNKFFNWFSHTAYIFNAQGEKLGFLKKNKFSINNSYTAEEFETNYEIGGKYFNRTMTIKKDENVVGTITVNWTFFVDKFTLETEDQENLPFYVALTIAIDNIKDNRNKK